MDDVFRAIDDPSRRLLLDKLFDEDGLTLIELCRVLPGMTRFGVMNHLRVLEQGGLITTRKVGRRKLHYLNPVPIRLIHDRWISKYTESVAARVVGLKRLVEGVLPMNKPTHVYRTYIAAPVDAVWHAIVDGDATEQYFYGTRVQSSWEVGAPIVYEYLDGRVAATGEVLEFDPPRRLDMTFLAKWDPELEKEGPVREVWLVEDVDGLTLVSVELWGVDRASKAFEDFDGGFPFILSGLKTLLETGISMKRAAS